MPDIEIDKETLLRVAMAIEGPHKPVPSTSKFTLEELRKIRWGNMSWQEHSTRMIQAKSAINEFLRISFKNT